MGWSILEKLWQGNRTFDLSGLLLEIPWRSSPVPEPWEVLRKGGSWGLPTLVWGNEGNRTVASGNIRQVGSW